MAVQDPLCGVKGWAVIGCGDMYMQGVDTFPYTPFILICAFHVFHLTATLMADLLADDSF